MHIYFIYIHTYVKCLYTEREIYGLCETSGMKFPTGAPELGGT